MFSSCSRDVIDRYHGPRTNGTSCAGDMLIIVPIGAVFDLTFTAFTRKTPSPESSPAAEAVLIPTTFGRVSETEGHGILRVADP